MDNKEPKKVKYSDLSIDEKLVSDILDMKTEYEDSTYRKVTIF